MASTDRIVITLSGDPVTNGHKHVIEKAIKEFPDAQKIVGLGHNSDKNATFPLEEKVDMIKHMLAEFNDDTISIEFYEGLLADFAFEKDATVIRGIRDEKDEAYEAALHTAGKLQRPDYETVYIKADPEYVGISSSIVRALQKENGDTSSLVPLYVKQRLEARMSGQYIIGMTGSIGAGKSTVGKSLVEHGKHIGIPVYNIEFDEIAKRVYTTNSPMAAKIRKELIEVFGEQIRGDDNATGLPESIDIKKLGDIYFANQRHYANDIERIFKNWNLYQRRKELRGKKGLIIANAAILPDYGLTHIVNHNMVLVGVNAEEQIKRIKERNNYSDVVAQDRISSQDNYEVKKFKILEAIENGNNGKLFEFDNSEFDPEDMRKEILFNEVIADMDIYGELRMQSLCSRIPDAKQRGNRKEILKNIKAEYDKNGLPYHNREHIMSVWNEFYKIKHMFSEDKADKVQWAILLHDIVYNTARYQNRVNEEKSAEYAAALLRQLGFDEAYIKDVMELIMDTKHRDKPTKRDGQLLADLDMAILAANKERFDTYENQIRQEYSNYIDEHYKKGRLGFLTGQQKKTIFYVLTKYEEPAKENIAHLIEKLS